MSELSFFNPAEVCRIENFYGLLPWDISHELCLFNKCKKCFKKYTEPSVVVFREYFKYCLSCAVNANFTCDDCNSSFLEIYLESPEMEGYLIFKSIKNNEEIYHCAYCAQEKPEIIEQLTKIKAGEPYYLQTLDDLDIMMEIPVIKAPKE